MELVKICEFLDRELQLAQFEQDHSNNGLQVQGRGDVNKMVFAVDASLELFELAAERDADFIFVHHGISWDDRPRRFTGTTGKRLRTLFANGISLYAAHLPLDAHEKYGNNARLTEITGLQKCFTFFEYCGKDIGIAGELPQAKSVAEIAGIFAETLGADVQCYGKQITKAQRIGIVSGGAADALSEAAKNRCDLLITGEMTHAHFHPALENEICVMAIGHYASEKVGPLAIMELLKEKFSLPCEFIDIPTGL